MDDTQLLKSRLSDLSRRAFERNYTTFSDFLTMEEVGILSTMKSESPFIIYGGYEGAERCVAAFGDKVNYSDFPIDCVEISPLLQKFADSLTHRDFLGSLMNLGINRSTLGDIIVADNVGYLFCLRSMSEYICDSLTRIKHTTVSCRVIDELPDCAVKEPEVKEIITGSLRTDAVIAAVYHLSRNDAKTLFLQDRVFVNHKPVSSTSHILNDGDTVSVRGHGKFVFNGTLRSTKKDRLVIEIGLYI
ncbi:MAG: hypothetical protein E7571_05965 [Ruminococcaceae bacterium]|nr:hypothetical protein [Oscillospiraceae bacterium]